MSQQEKSQVLSQDEVDALLSAIVAEEGNEVKGNSAQPNAPKGEKVSPIMKKEEKFVDVSAAIALQTKLTTLEKRLSDLGKEDPAAGAILADFRQKATAFVMESKKNGDVTNDEVPEIIGNLLRALIKEAADKAPGLAGSLWGRAKLLRKKEYERTPLKAKAEAAQAANRLLALINAKDEAKLAVEASEKASPDMWLSFREKLAYYARKNLGIKAKMTPAQSLLAIGLMKESLRKEAIINGAKKATPAVEELSILDILK